MTDEIPVQTLQTQNVAPGAKTTNVIMHNQQAVIMEYYSEATIPDEIMDARPIECLMLNKRAIGNETEWDIMMNDIEFDMISMVRMEAGEEVALDLALGYLHHREGLRAKGMSERIAQVTQRTLEELKTISASNKVGIIDKIRGFAKGEKAPSNPFQQPTQR